METELRFEINDFTIRCSPDGEVRIQDATGREAHLTGEEFDQIWKRRKLLLRNHEEMVL